MRTSVNRHHSNIGASSIQDFDQNSRLQGIVGAKPVQDGNANTSESRPLPRPNHYPDLTTALLKFDAAPPMTLDPSKDSSKNAGEHPVQDDRLKHNTNKPVNIDAWS